MNALSTTLRLLGELPRGCTFFMAAGLPIVLEWKPLDPPRGSLLGFCRVQFPSGLIINSVTIHQNSGKAWAAPPGVPWVKDGRHLPDPAKAGKLGYSPAVDFANHGVRKRWSEQIVVALQLAHPHAIPTALENAEEQS